MKTAFVYLAIFFVATTSFATLSFAAITAPTKITTDTCGKGKTGITDYSYCVYPSTDINNKDLIIHFHGLGGSENSWKTNANYEQVRRYAVGWGYSLPTVVTVSLGKLWLLTEVAAKGNRYGTVTKTIIPFLENLAGFKPDEGVRYLVGESMGGFNALQVFSRNPNMFAKVAALCPVAADLTPWSSQTEIDDYIKRTGAQTVRVKFFVGVATEEFPTPLDWENHNPLKFASKIAPTLTKVYLSGDEQDEYGFYEGATILNQIFSAKFINYQWEPIPAGHHCDMNPRSLAKFLTQ